MSDAGRVIPAIIKSSVGACAALGVWMSSPVSHAHSRQQPAEAPPATGAAEPAPPVVADSAWDAARGRRLELRLVDGGLRGGTLVGFDDATVTLADEDGALHSFARADVREVRITGPSPAVAYGPAPAPRPDADEYRGTGRIITGKVVTSVGGVYLGLGVVALLVGLGSESDDLVPASVSLMTWGAVHLAVGIPLLVSGKRARERHDMRMETLGKNGRLRLSPLAAPRRGGFTAGLSLSF